MRRPNGYPILDSWKKTDQTVDSPLDLIEFSRIQIKPEKVHLHPSLAYERFIVL